MASILRDPSGNFHIHFRFGGQRFKRSLHTKHERKAQAAASHVEENIRLIGEGRLALPDDVDVPTYLLSDGKLAEQPKANGDCKLGMLFAKYRELVPEGAAESTTLRSIGTSELQHYITVRSKESGRRGKLSAVTIRKEIATFRVLRNCLLRHNGRTRGLIAALVQDGSVRVAGLDTNFLCCFEQFANSYRNRAVDLADGSLVYLAERPQTTRIFTVDKRDFTVYRIAGEPAFDISVDASRGRDLTAVSLAPWFRRLNLTSQTVTRPPGNPGQLDPLLLECDAA